MPDYCPPRPLSNTRLNERQQITYCYEQITAVLNRDGWFNTVYRGGVRSRPWHYEYDYTRDQHINEGSPTMAQDARELTPSWTGQRTRRIRQRAEHH